MAVSDRDRVSGERTASLRVIVLAAGQGKRLLPLTARMPKAMVRINGISLINRTVDALLGNPFVGEVVVVGGYCFDVLSSALRSQAPLVSTIFNRSYATHGPQASVLTGLEQPWQGDLLIINGDTLIDPTLIDHVLQVAATTPDPLTLFGSSASTYADDDVRIVVKESHVRDVGKRLSEPSRWRSCGILHVHGSHALDEIRHVMAESLAAGEATWHGALRTAIGEGWPIRFNEVPGDDWSEIDTLVDLEQCQARLTSRFQNKRTSSR